MMSVIVYYIYYLPIRARDIDIYIHIYRQYTKYVNRGQ